MDTDSGQVETAQIQDQMAPAATSSAVENSSPLSTFDYDAINAGFQSGPAVEKPDGEQDGANAGETENKENGEQAAPVPEVETPADSEVDLNNLPEKLRTRFSDPEDIAIATLARAKGIPLSKAADLYRGQHPTTQAEPEVKTPEAAEPTATEKLQGEVDALKAEIETAEESDDYLSPAHLKKVRELGAKESKLEILKFQDQQNAQSKERTEVLTRHDEIGRAQQASQDEVAKVYPDFIKEGTALHIAAVAVVAELQATPEGLAILRSGDAPERVLSKALLRAPQAAPAAAPKAPAAPSTPVVQPPAAPPARRVNPAPGSQTQANPNQASNPAALLKEIGFDPEKAGSALYGDARQKSGFMS